MIADRLIKTLGFKGAPGDAHGSHLYWRLWITDTTGGSPNYVEIPELEMRATVGGADQTFDGIATGSPHYATQTPDLAFDGDIGTRYTATTAEAPWFIQYQFIEEVSVLQIALLSHDTETSFPRTPSVFELQYSDNDVDWVPAQSWTAIDWDNNEWRTFNV